ncbi:MAG TPA: glycosyltransferase family 39 protein [Caulobacteraceae bacterium]
MAFAVIFLTWDIASRPIVLWDESRLAVNALEMSQHGFSLITTYGFQPDLWNTKPPLLIWLMAGSIRLFGPEEWAIRAPSLLAGLATLALVMRFSWRLSRSAGVAATATLTLLLSFGFFGNHAAASGDYDALLTLFTTGYILLLFETLHRRRPDASRVIACGLLIAGACLTKGIAGLAPGAGIATYVLARHRWPRLFQTPWYAAAGLIAAVLVGGYYALREAASHGYLAAVIYNEIDARYVRGFRGHIHSPLFYLGVLSRAFAFGPAFALPFLAMATPWKRTKSAAFLVYANHVSLLLILVYSLGRTKIFWYLMPIYPVLSIAFAISARHVLGLLRRNGPDLLTRPIVGRVSLLDGLVGLAAAAAALGALVYDVKLPVGMNLPQGRYGQVFAQLQRQGILHIRTLDSGVPNDELHGYTPQLRFYSLAWRGRGLDVAPGDPNTFAAEARNAVLVTCDPRYLDKVRALGPPRTSIADCAAAAGPSGR